MRGPLTSARELAALVTVAALALAAPAVADEQVSTGSTTTGTTPAATPTSTSTTTAPAATPSPSEPNASAAPPSTTTTTTSPQEPGAPQAPGGTGPRVRKQHIQRTTSSHPHRAHAKRTRAKAKKNKKKRAQSREAKLKGLRGGRRAPSPSNFTPPLPSNLGSLAGVPGFFVESFQVPPFLLPIYQAAGSAYDVPWQVLAAINEVETDYGRDLSVSSAGAEGWMQFLPAEWAQYGVDVNGDGFKDPYNPADAIFAAARYLHAAGAANSIKAAVYSYNHSQAYVSTVMLRAQLLAGTPPELLGAITGLTQSRFPVHAPAHFGDGFETVRTPSGTLETPAGTTIYSQPDAPVIAVQDGEVIGAGESPTLGRYVSLRDGYGNVYTYAQLGSIAPRYPVLEPRRHGRSHPASASNPAPEPPPRGPATAGAQPRSPLSLGAVVSGLAFGAAASLETAPAAGPATPSRPATKRVHRSPQDTNANEFAAGQNEVFLHELHVGVQVIAGTVLGHIGAATGSSGDAEPTPGAPGAADAAGQDAHMLFQIRPAGTGAPLIDPKPILDGWVALENTSTFRARGEDPFHANAPTAGQVLLESKGQLEKQVAHDTRIRMRRCEREDLQTGRVDKRVLATIELLSVSRLDPTISGLSCGSGSPASEVNPSAGAVEVIRIDAINGVSIAGHQGPGSIADTTVRKLLTLQGADRPLRIVSLERYPHSRIARAKPSARDYVSVAFGPSTGASAHAASTSSPLTPIEWTRLIARLGEIPDPTVAGGPSSAAIPDTGAGAAGSTGSPGTSGSAGAPPTSGTGAESPSSSAGAEGGAGGND